MKDRRNWVSLFSITGVALVLGLLLSSFSVPIPKVLPFSKPSLPDDAALIVAAEYQSDAALKLASADLSQALAALGVSLRILDDAERIELATLNIVVGNPDSEWIARLVAKEALSLPEMGEEAYVVQSTSYRGVPFVAIAGGSVIGQAYGIFRLIETIKLDPSALGGDLNLRGAPAMTLRLVSSPGIPTYPGPEDALRWGFNAVMIEPWPSLPLYDGFDPAIFDPKKQAHDREWVESNRARARQQIAEAKALHLKVVTMGDVFHLPRQALTLYGGQVASDDNPGLFCIARPKTKALLSHGLNEVLSDFPDIDAVMIRTGENYPLGPLSGNSPAQGACGGLVYTERLRQVIDVVYNQVVSDHGRVFIYRSWDLGASGTHARPEVARAALQDLQGNPGLITSFKQTQTDFWRYNPVNPSIGEIAGEQMVEFQMAREYEGKGAFPNYLGEILAQGAPEIEPRGGMEYFYNKGVRAIWVWAKGGGWGGPHPQSDIWIEPNIFAAAHLAWDPALSPAALAEEWATLRFGPEAAPSLARLLVKSSDAVLQTFYVGPAARTFGPWTPHNLWLRDDIVYGEPYMSQLYQALRDDEDFGSALREKEQALKIIDSMVLDMETVRGAAPDQKLSEQAMNTLRYERSIAETLGDYLGGMLYYYRWKDAGKDDSGSHEQALGRLRNWFRSWQTYETEVAHLEGVASPYRDAGMIKAATQALTELQEGR